MIRIKGKPIVEFQSIAANRINWSTLLLVASALVIGNNLAAAGTGVSEFLTNMFAPIFEGRSPLVFTILVLVIALIATNFANSLVMGLILMPIILSFAETLSIAPQPIVVVFVYTVLFGAVTPAASPFAAMMHGNKEWIKTKDLYVTSIIFSIMVLGIVIGVGVPLANLMF